MTETHGPVDARPDPVGRRASIVGEVESRQGDGTNLPIPRGVCEVRLTPLDATLSWLDGRSHGLAVMPVADFERHLAAGRIVYLEAPDAAFDEIPAPAEAAGATPAAKAGA